MKIEIEDEQNNITNQHLVNTFKYNNICTEKEENKKKEEGKKWLGWLVVTGRGGGALIAVMVFLF